MQSNIKIYIYVLTLTGIIAVVLASLFNVLNPMFQKNKEIAKKKAILSCIPGQKSDVDVEGVFGERVKVIVLDAEGKVIFEQKGAGAPEELKTESAEFVTEMNKRGLGVKYNSVTDIDLSSEEKFADEDRIYPIYKYAGEAGKAFYVVSVRGNGLWDKIWGYVALENKEAKWAVAGASFDHKGETPGLGAEIKDNKSFKESFKGKQIFDAEGKFVSVKVMKKKPKPEVAAYQVQGISGATITCDGVSEMMNRGINYYLPYLKTVK